MEEQLGDLGPTRLMSLRNKTISLKTVKQVESDTTENEESDIAFLAKQLRIIHEYRKKNMSKTPRFFESSRKTNEENPSGKN